MITINGKYCSAYIMIDEIEPTCLSQIVLMTNHPAFTNDIVIMPDCHAGAGAVIGFTMPITDKIIPNVIGYDTGCGMLSFFLDIDSYNRKYIDSLIREWIPFGSNVNDEMVISNTELKAFFDTVNKKLIKFKQKYEKQYKYFELKKLCLSLNIKDDDIIQKIYENTFENGIHTFNNDIMECLKQF